jgi:DNA replication and repair protein RecF
MFISQVKPSYFFCLHQYIKILHQRNALLRQAREDRGLRGTIEAWDLPLADAGARIMHERRQFALKLGSMARAGHAAITGGGEDLEIGYAQSVKMPGDGAGDSGSAGVGAGIGAGVGIGDIRDAYLQQLRKSADIDIMRMSTTYGPHKDDLSFRLDGRNIRVYGSQGQQRTAALALKMAQVGVMREETGHLPVLLLDDVMSELDSARQARMPLGAWEAQAVITCTDRDGGSPAFGPATPAGATGPAGAAVAGPAETVDTAGAEDTAVATRVERAAETAAAVTKAVENGGATDGTAAGGGRAYFFVSGGTVRREE